jgi:hypothetical protein
MNNVRIDFGINDGTTKIVAASDIVFHGITFRFGSLHGIGSSTLFGKMDNGIGFFLLDEFDQQIIVLGDIHIDKLDILATDFLPSLTTNL